MQRKNQHLLAKLAAAACVVALPLAGCNGDDPFVPPPETDQGTVALAVTDATADPEPVVAAFQADARLQLFADGEWHDVTGLTAAQIEADIHGPEDQVASADVEARTWEQARVILTNATVAVTAGSEINGEPIAADVTVSVAAGDEVIVTYPQPVIVQADETVRFVLVLGSPTWLTAGAVAEGAVTAADFEAAASLTFEAGAGPGG